MKQQHHQFDTGIVVLFVYAVCQLCGSISHIEHDLSLIQLNFTSCGKTGRNGPTYNDCVQYYRSQNSTVWKSLVNQTSFLVGAQFFQIPITGTYDILIVGASGGKGVCSPYVGGGAVLHSQRFLDSDQLYAVTIGQSGDDACDNDRFPRFCNMSVEDCTQQYKKSYQQNNFKSSPPNCSFDGGGGGGGGTVFNEISEQSDGSGLVFLQLYSAAGGGGSGAIFNGSNQTRSYANADGVQNNTHKSVDFSNGERPQANTCPYSGFGGGNIRGDIGEIVDGYPNTLPAINGADRSYKLGGLGCAVNGTNGGFGGGGGACVSGGGGGGFGGGSVLTYSPYEPGQGGTSSLSTTVNFNGEYNYYGSGYVTVTLLDCGCTGKCIRDINRNVFHCACENETMLAPDGLDCFKGMHYDNANFTLTSNFTTDKSNFGSVDFTIYRAPKIFGIYGAEIVFDTPNETAQCALATAFYSEYTGVTEIVTLTASYPNITNVVSEVKTNIISTPTINYVEGVEVSSPIPFHNKSITVSELVVLSFIPQTRCMLRAAFFNKSLRQYVETDSFNETTLTVLADEFLNSFYRIQDQKPPTGTPTDSDDTDGDSERFPISAIAGSIAFVLGLILVLLVMLWLGNKFFSHNKNLFQPQPDSASSTVPLILSRSNLDDSVTPGYETVDGPSSKIHHYEVLDLSLKFETTTPEVDFYAYNCQRKHCNLNSEERWGYPREYLVYLREIGEGQFGKVHLMNAKNICGFKGTVPVAVKVLGSREEADIKIFTEEAELLKRFSHPNIVSLLGFCCATEDASPMMILEFMQFGDLQSFLVHNKPSSKSMGLSISIFYSIAADVATALDFLSSHRYVHRDVAARNCLVGKNMHVKLADFGLARRMEDKDYYLMGGKRVLPVRWMAPESLVYGLSTSASDVWSYGVVLWEIVTYGEMPHPALNVQELMQLAEADKLCLEKPSGCPDSFYETICLCQQPNAKNRPSFAALLVWAQQHLSSHDTSVV